jgi:CheY-like chemotaxis protein
MGMDGIELTGIITRNWDIPVIVMTGYKPETQKNDALSAGASAFFGKPFPLLLMEECILNLLSNNHRNNQPAIL